MLCQPAGFHFHIDMTGWKITTHAFLRLNILNSQHYDKHNTNYANLRLHRKIIRLVADNNTRSSYLENLSPWPTARHWSLQTGYSTIQIKPPYKGKQQFIKILGAFMFTIVLTQNYIYKSMYILRLGIWYNEGAQKLPLQ